MEDLVFFEAACKRLEVGRSDTTLPEDKTRILSDIKASAGVKSMQTAVQEAMMLSVRWGTPPALQAALMLSMSSSSFPCIMPLSS